MTIRIDLDNDCMSFDHAEERDLEIARLVRIVADRIARNGPAAVVSLPLRDINGNRIGVATITD